jgi:hypothetical protein
LAQVRGGVEVAITPGRYFRRSRARVATGSAKEGLELALSTSVIANEFVGFDALQWIVGCSVGQISTFLKYRLLGAGRGHDSARFRRLNRQSLAAVWLVGSQVPPGT